MNSLNGDFQNAALEKDYNVRFISNINRLDENLPITVPKKGCSVDI